MTVFMLWHMRPYGPDETDDEGETDDKLCGVFTTKGLAEAARQQLTQVQGFCDYPDDFLIDAVTLDEVHWDEGFVSLPPGE